LNLQEIISLVKLSIALGYAHARFLYLSFWNVLVGLTSTPFAY